MKNVSVIFIALILSSCGWLQKKEDPEKGKERAELTEAQAIFQKGEFKQAQDAFTHFLSEHPVSIYKYRAQMGLAHSLEKQDQWDEALKIYRQILQASADVQPEVAAQVLFLSSFCYEALGDDVKTLSSLKDAERLSDKLPPEIAWAELPARLAGVYNRLDRLDEAREQMHKAEKGVSRLRAKQDFPATNEWMAEIFYSMSLFSTHQLGVDNFKSQLDTLKMMQSFSIRAVLFEAEPWSRLASESLKKNYQNFWLVAKEAKDYQGCLGLLQALFEAGQFQNFDSNEKDVHSKDFFAFIDSLSREINTFVYNLDPLNPLTPEAQERQQLKKTRIKLKPVSPEIEPKKEEKKDPNL